MIAGLPLVKYSAVRPELDTMGDNVGWSQSHSAASTPSQVSTGSLKTKISIKAGAASSYTVVSPFYTIKPELPPKSVTLGSTDLLSAYDLGSVYSRFCGNRKMRDDLASFLPSIYGNLNMTQTQDISSLKMLVEKPPITGKEISTLSATSMTGFRLNPGQVDERYRYLFERKRDGDMMPSAYEAVDRNVIGQRYKHSLDSLDGEDSERRKHKGDKKEKKKKKDKKKKDKKDDERKNKKAPDGSVPMEM